MDHKYFMKEALAVAAAAIEEGELPIPADFWNGQKL